MLAYPTKNKRRKSKFEELYDYYGNLIMYISMDILHNQALAEEAMQDALIKMLIHLDDIEEITCRETKSWVVTVSRRAALDKLDYEKRRAHESDIKLNELKGVETLPDDKAICNITIQEILGKLKSINKLYSETILLRYYYGYTDKQLAIHYGISTAAVRKRCERGKKYLLRDMIRKGDFDE